MDSRNSLFGNNYIIYPKTNKFTNKKRLNKLKSSYNITNPLINHFSISSFFIYDQIDHINYFNSLSNKNSIKLNNDEISFLQSIIDSIQIEKSINEKEEFISIEKDMFDKINLYFKVSRLKTPLITYLEDKIKNSTNRANISCRKLANDYFIDTGNKVGKSTINNILKNNLGYRYLKTCIKNNNLKSNIGILSCFCFIKIITRFLKLGFLPIFIDESKIELCNNHFKVWRFSHEQIYFGNSIKNKTNLILAVGMDSVFHYKITSENTTSKIFLEFLNELEEKLKCKENLKFIYILDNLSSHKSEEIIDYLINNKRNVIFNAPYFSFFNNV